MEILPIASPLPDVKAKDTEKDKLNNIQLIEDAYYAVDYYRTLHSVSRSY